MTFTLNLGKVIQFTNGVIVTLVMALNVMLVNGVLVAQLLGTAREFVMPEGLFYLFVLATAYNIFATIFVMKKGWHWFM